MQEIIIRASESGQRFDRFLKKYFKNAPDSFIYKMLRKKNIILNGKKSTGKEMLAEQDVIKLFLAEETIRKFSPAPDLLPRNNPFVHFKPDIIYEDSDIILVNKPVGMLSQKAEVKDFSMVEAIQFYLTGTGGWIPAESLTFKPALCNRLDRNTSGIVIAGKSTEGLQIMSAMLKERSVCKYYLCIVKGKLTEPAHLKGYLTKDCARNRSTVSIVAGEQEIETAYIPIAWSADMTLLKVHLLTGRPHQIRVHLAGTGHPLLGDPKYGDKVWNNTFADIYNLRHQLLHAYELTMPDHIPGRFFYLSGKEFTARVPEIFYKIIKEHKWQHGTQEALEVLH